MQALFETQRKETFAMALMDHYDNYDFQNTHELSIIIAPQDLLSPFTSSDTSSAESNFASPSSVDSDETKESLSLAKQSKKISKQKTRTKKDKAASQKGLWSPSEDAKLISLVKEYGQQWAKISSMMPKKGRKQLRDRYLNALIPGINWGEWTTEEENQLEALHARLGNKWCEIAAQMPGRTENQVKNKYYRDCKTYAKNVKASSKVQQKQRKEKVSKNQADNFNLLDKILLSETEIEQNSSIDTELTYSEEPQRLNILEDVVSNDFLEENYWATGIAIQQQTGDLYKDIDAYFCF